MVTGNGGATATAATGVLICICASSMACEQVDLSHSSNPTSDGGRSWLLRRSLAAAKTLKISSHDCATIWGCRKLTLLLRTLNSNSLAKEHPRRIKEMASSIDKSSSSCNFLWLAMEDAKKVEENTYIYMYL